MATETPVNPDLVKERAGATFSVREMTNMWDGGAEKTKRRQEMGDCSHHNEFLY